MVDKPVRERFANEKPLREKLTDVTGSIPEGPLNNIGGGNFLGFVGFLIVESGQVITTPIPGLTRPGFRKVSHSVEVVEPGLQRNEVVVHAFTEEVAKFMSRYDSSPSNFDFLAGEVEVTEVTELDSDASYDTYEMVVMVDRRPLE